MDDIADKSFHLRALITDYAKEEYRFGYSYGDALLAGYFVAWAINHPPKEIGWSLVTDSIIEYLDRFLWQHWSLQENSSFLASIYRNHHGSLLRLARQSDFLKPGDSDFLATLDWLIESSDSDITFSLTPRAVASLMVDLLDVNEGSVLDPAAGTGGFLRACEESEDRNIAFTGIELNNKICFVSNLYGFFQENKNFRWLQGSAFGHAQDIGDFDFVLSNPPISRLPKHEAYFRYRDSLGNRSFSNEMSLNFIQLSLNKLKPSGKAAFLVHMGILYSQGDAAQVRREWVERNELSAVICLPGKLLAHTSNKCAILLFDKRRHQENTVHFVKADDLFVEAPRGVNTLCKDAFSVITARLQDHSQTPVSCEISVNVIRSEGFSLHPDSYVKKEITEIAQRVAKRWEKLGDIALVQQGTRGLSKLPPGESATIKGKTIRGMMEGCCDYDHKDISGLKSQPVRVQAFDLIVQRLGDDPAAIVIPADMEGLIIDETVFLLRFRDADPAQIYFVAEFINSKRGASHIASFCRSSTVQTLTKTILQQVDVPIADDALKELVLETRAAELALKQELLKANQLKLQVFEGLGFEKLEDSFDELRFSVKTLENALENRNKVSYIVANQYPFPLAFAYRNIYTEREWTAIYDRQLKYGEQLLSFLASVGLSLLVFREGALAESVQVVAEEFFSSLSRGLSPGHWRELLRQVCEKLRDVSDCELSYDFSSIWYRGRGSKLSDFALRTGSEFVQQLNDKKHWRGPDGADAAKIEVDRKREAIDRALSEIQFISQWVFFISDELNFLESSKIFSCSVSILRGDHPCFEQSELELDHPISTGSLCVKYKNDIFSLFPLMTVSFNPQTKRREIFTLDKREKSGNYLLKSFDSGSAITAGSELKSQLDSWFLKKTTSPL